MLYEVGSWPPVSSPLVVGVESFAPPPIESLADVGRDGLICCDSCRNGFGPRISPVLAPDLFDVALILLLREGGWLTMILSEPRTNCDDRGVDGDPELVARCCIEESLCSAPFECGV